MSEVCPKCAHEWAWHDHRDPRAPDEPCCEKYAGMGESCGCDELPPARVQRLLDLSDDTEDTGSWHRKDPFRAACDRYAEGVNETARVTHELAAAEDRVADLRMALARASSERDAALTVLGDMYDGGRGK